MEVYSFHLNATQENRIKSSQISNKRSGLILNSILTPIFYSKFEAFNRFSFGGLSSGTSIYDKEPEGFSCRVQVAACYLERDGKLLLVQRALDRLEKGRWGVPAGKLEKNETPLDAAVRELFEETGIRVDPVSQVRYLCYLFMRKPEIDYLFHMFKIEIDHCPVVCLSNEHQNYRWTALEEIGQMELMAGGNITLQYYLERRVRKREK